MNNKINQPYQWQPQPPQPKKTAKTWKVWGGIAAVIVGLAVVGSCAPDSAESTASSTPTTTTPAPQTSYPPQPISPYTPPAPAPSTATGPAATGMTPDEYLLVGMPALVKQNTTLTDAELIIVGHDTCGVADGRGAAEARLYAETTLYPAASHRDAWTFTRAAFRAYCPQHVVALDAVPR